MLLQGVWKCAFVVSMNGGRRETPIYQSVQSIIRLQYISAVPADITVGTETFYEYLAFWERRFLYLIQRLCYSVRYRLGVGVEIVVKQAVVAVIGYEAYLGKAARHIRTAVDEIVLPVLAGESGFYPSVFGYSGSRERVADVLRESGVFCGASECIHISTPCAFSALLR